MISSLDILAEAAALYSAPLNNNLNKPENSNDSKIWADANKRDSIRELVKNNLQISGYSSDHSSGYSSTTNNEVFSPSFNSQEESRFQIPDSSPINNPNELNLFSFNQNAINLSIKNLMEKAENKSESINENLNNLASHNDKIMCQTIPSTRPKRKIKPTIKAIESKDDIDIEKLLQSTSIITTNDENIKIKIEDTSATIRGMRERRKSQKTPEHLKDKTYIERRIKNNIAAKKSRENKNSLIKASYKLKEIKEKENVELKKELNEQIALVGIFLNNLNKDPIMKKSALEIIKDKNLKFYEKLLELN